MAYKNEIDSLQQLIEQAEYDSTRVDLMLELSSVYFGTYPTKAIDIAREAQAIAESDKYLKGAAYSLKNVGIGYYYQGDYVEALTAWQQSLEVFKSIDDKVGVANIINNIGAIYYNEGDYNNALDYYLKSLKVSEEIPDTLRILTALLNIGAVYNDKPKTHDKALEYSHRALDLSEKIGDKDAIATSSVNIGEIYLYRKDLDRALEYFDKSLAAMEGQDGIVYSMVSISKVYSMRKEYDKALAYLEEALAIAAELNAKPNKAHALLAMAEIFRQMGQLDKAQRMYSEGTAIAEEINSLKELVNGYAGLQSVYSQKGIYDSAYKYQRLLMNVKDSLYDIATDKLLSNQMFNFQIEKKQNEINLLKKDQELKDLDIQKQKVINGLVSAGFFSVFIFLVVVAFQKKRISKEKDRSEKLLLNILPFEVAEELKDKGKSEARNYDQVTVLFTDFMDFTGLSQQMSAKELVEEINYYFMAFDEIINRYKIEKIKTIGDAYMAAGGLPVPNKESTKNVIMAGLEMQQVVKNRAKVSGASRAGLFKMRLGIHSGPVVAGIVGVKKFQYDIWGDTVNTASRLESCGEVGRVNISEATYRIIKDDPDLEFTWRGKIEAKGKGEIEMFFVNLKGSTSTTAPDSMETSVVADE